MCVAVAAGDGFCWRAISTGERDKQRIARRKVVRTNLEALLVARRLLDQYEELWRARIDRMNQLIAETAGASDTVETKESNR